MRCSAFVVVVLFAVFVVVVVVDAACDRLYRDIRCGNGVEVEAEHENENKSTAPNSSYLRLRRDQKRPF